MAKAFKIKMMSLKLHMLNSLRILNILIMALRSLRVNLLNSPNVMHNLKLHIQKIFPNYILLLLLMMICATNSISCEEFILKENVELRAQLELLTSKYGKLVESHEKLSSSNDDLLVFHDKL